MKIQKIDLANPKAVDVPRILSENNVRYNNIDILNWPDKFPYKPTTSFGIAHTGKSILLHFKAKEYDVRGFITEDLGNVWTDACVEFFIAPENDGRYYNIECNCLGKILLAVGEGRHDRKRAAHETVAQIDRWASLGGEFIGEIEEETEWEVALVVPYSALFAHNIKSLDNAKANFYKCGGTGKFTHYVSWAPISTPAPDFHRPEFFQEVQL